jgi:hypothetical protein
MQTAGLMYLQGTQAASFEASLTDPPIQLVANVRFRYKSPPLGAFARRGPSTAFHNPHPFGSPVMTLVRASLIVALVLLIAAPWSAFSVGQSPKVPPSIGNTKLLDMKGQLEKGLKARRPVEFEYISNVVTMVENGTLPRTLVDTTFGYARKQRRPLQYFEFALQVRAKKAGIDVPTIEKIVTPTK